MSRDIQKLLECSDPGLQFGHVSEILKTWFWTFLKNEKDWLSPGGDDEVDKTSDGKKHASLYSATDEDC